MFCCLIVLWFARQFRRWWRSVGFRKGAAIVIWKPVILLVFSSTWHYESSWGMGSVPKLVWLKAEKHLAQIQESSLRQWFEFVALITSGDLIEYEAASQNDLVNFVRYFCCWLTSFHGQRKDDFAAVVSLLLTFIYRTFLFSSGAQCFRIVKSFRLKKAFKIIKSSCEA